MVYVPILKVDLPEPSIQEILPGVVHAFINTCTRVFDLVHDYLRPLSPEQEVILYTAAIEHLPEEFRKARKKIAENNIIDQDKMSEELEDASYAYYRYLRWPWPQRGCYCALLLHCRALAVCAALLQAANEGVHGRLLR